MKGFLMPMRSLPVQPDLAELKTQADELRHAHRAGDRTAAARIVAHHPRMKKLDLQGVLAVPLALADVRLVIAREYGFENWAGIKNQVELAARIAKLKPHPRFVEAVAAMDAGDVIELHRLLESEPALTQARTNLDAPYNYFTGATLLHHVAGNPDRGRFTGALGPMPKNIVEIARVLLDCGADVHATTLGRGGYTTMGLLCTSKQASDSNLAGPLIELLLEHGAALDLERPGALDAALANHAPRAAEKMIELGARPDIFAAAALGRIDLLEEAFDKNGRLRSRPRRRGRVLSGRDAIGLALLFAYVCEQPAAIDFLLEKDGNWNMIGVNNGTALHRAASEGDLGMVERLVARGADVNNRNNPFTATPYSWAEHHKQTKVCQWMREHCAIDLHDAVCFDLSEHIVARLNETPASVDRCIDQWDIPRGTPLHWCARLNRKSVAIVLLEHGADPNIVAGDGATALDIAERAGSGDVARVIERHGGKRAAAL